MEEIQNVFNQVKEYCRPRYSTKEEAMTKLCRQLFNGKYSNFIGGCNDKRRTMHESMFALMYPDLMQQAPFGTKKGGYKKYGFKRIIADFYDPDRGIVYEIDGRNHTEELQELKDQVRGHFLALEYGVETIRISNEAVEKMMLDRLKTLKDEGRLSC